MTMTNPIVRRRAAITVMAIGSVVLFIYAVMAIMGHVPAWYLFIAPVCSVLFGRASLTSALRDQARREAGNG